MFSTLICKDLQLLSDCSCSFGRTTVLQLYNLHEIDYATEIIHFVLIAGQTFDLNSDGGIWFLLVKEEE